MLCPGATDLWNGSFAARELCCVLCVAVSSRKTPVVLRAFRLQALDRYVRSPVSCAHAFAIPVMVITSLSHQRRAARVRYRHRPPQRAALTGRQRTQGPTRSGQCERAEVQHSDGVTQWAERERQGCARSVGGALSAWLNKAAAISKKKRIPGFEARVLARHMYHVSATCAGMCLVLRCFQTRQAES